MKYKYMICECCEFFDCLTMCYDCVHSFSPVQDNFSCITDESPEHKEIVKRMYALVENGRRMNEIKKETARLQVMSNALDKM